MPPATTVAASANPVSPLARCDFLIAEFLSWVSPLGCESCQPRSVADLSRTFGEPAAGQPHPPRRGSRVPAMEEQRADDNGETGIRREHHQPGPRRDRPETGRDGVLNGES